jgi:kynurenine formamidase
VKLIDLTHTISEDMPVYPGTESPSLRTTNTYEKDGFKETLLNMYSHTGTHMDAPSHIFGHKSTLDAQHISQFTGVALVVDCRHLNEGDTIEMSCIDSVRSMADQAEFILFNTGWDKHWGTPQYFGDYPCISHEVAHYLIESGKKGIGLDTIGLDPISDPNLTLHRKVLSGDDFVIIENLTHLDQVGFQLFELYALPMKYKNSDGAPIRAVARIIE